MFLKALYSVTVAAVLVLPASFSFAVEIYQWTDEKGTVHFTDDPSKLLQPYSGKARKVGVPEEVSKEEASTPQPDQSSERVKRYLEDYEKRIEKKKRLEGKISKLEEELKRTEERLKKIEEYERETPVVYKRFVDPRTGQWKWGLISPYYEEKKLLKNKIETIQEEIRLLNEKISDLKRTL